MTIHVHAADLVGEGLRVLKRLATPGSRLERRHDFYVLTGTGRAGRALHVPAPIVDAFRRREWLAPVAGEDALRLSDVGLGWLKRTLGGEDPFRAQHATLTTVEAPSEDVLQTVTVNEGESPLTRLRLTEAADGKSFIDDTQFLAGERLRRDFTLANLMPRLTADLEAPVVAGRRGASHGEFSDIAVAARQRFSRAMDALGPDLSGIAIDVCCHLKEPAQTGDGGWTNSAGLVVLRLALDRLAHHYGFYARPRPRVRAWQAPEGAANNAPRQAKK